jgi:opacity protein-like surface antigen
MAADPAGRKTGPTARSEPVKEETKMRKLAVVLFAVASLCLMAFPAFAAKGDMAFGVGGGLAVPMGQLADKDYANMKLGYDGGLFFDYMLSKEIALGVDGSYAMTSNKDDSDLKGTSMQYGAHVKYFVPTGGQFLPYLNLGLAGYTRGVKFPDAIATEIGTDKATQTVLGMNAGVGVDYNVTPMVGIGVNGAYHYTFGEFKPDINGEKVKMLDDWTYMTFNAVVTFHFPTKK